MLSSLKYSQKLAYLAGTLTADGHIQIDKYRNLISYYSNNLSDIKKIQEILKKLSRKEPYIYTDNSKDKRGISHLRYKLFLHSKELAYFLRDSGVPVGNKTNNQFNIPSWIFSGPSAYKKSYIQAIYDCEGYIYATRGKKVRWRIGLEMYKNQALKKNAIDFFEQIKRILLEFRIKSSPIRIRKGNKRKDGSLSLGFIIDIEFSSFRNFYKFINFLNKDKRGKLEKAILSCSCEGNV